MSSRHHDPRFSRLPTGALLVRPDLVVIPFSLSVEEQEPHRAVTLAGAMLGAAEERLRPLGARLLVRGLRPQSFHGEGKGVEGSASTVVDGVVEVDLPLVAPVERALRVAAVLGALRALVIEGRKQRPPVSAAVGSFVAQVREPESYRAELLARWREQLQGVVEAASAAGAALAPLRLAEPGPVHQSPLSLEQIELSLTLQRED